MLAKSIYEYFHFGMVVRFLQDAAKAHPVHAEGFIIPNLDAFLQRLKDLDLQVTQRAALDLRQYVEEFRKLPADARLTDEQASRLRSLVRDLRLTLEAELQGFQAYVVTPKRLDVKRLLTDVGSLMAPGIFDELPPTANRDFIEAGKCIAFERPTAAAFHILRGTESVLRHFYCSTVRRNRCEQLLWGPMVDSLRKRRTPPPEALTQNLDNIRRLFRNPTAHPEKVYDIQEVQDLFALCVDVVNRMVTTDQWKKLPKPKVEDRDIAEILKKLLESEEQAPPASYEGKADKGKGQQGG